MRSTEYFVKNVKTLIKRQHISLQELGDLAGVSQGGLSDLLAEGSERIPRLDYAERVANALGYPLAALLCDLEYPCLEVPCSANKNTECVVAILPKVRSSMVNLWHHDHLGELRDIESEFVKRNKISLMMKEKH